MEKFKSFLEDDIVKAYSIEELQQKLEEEYQKPFSEQDICLLEELSLSILELQDSATVERLLQLERRYGEELKKPFKKQDFNLLNVLAEEIMCLKGISISPIPFEEIQNLADEKKSKRFKKMRRASIAMVACVGALFIVTLTVAAMGYNVLDMIRMVLKFPEKTTINFGDGNDIIRSDDTRYYNSMNEMLDKEALNIIYPSKLPDGYNFTGFMITDYKDYIEVIAYSVSPYISFSVEIGVHYQIDYDYENNSIKYNITETINGDYQAYWSDEKDSYSIIVSDEAILSEIIKNFKES